MEKYVIGLKLAQALIINTKGSWMQITWRNGKKGWAILP